MVRIYDQITRHRWGAYVARMVCVGLCLGVSFSAWAVEPAREFLDVLKERHFYDEALAYLDTLATDPTVPADMKSALDFERGKVLVEGSRFKRDVKLRGKDLDLAQEAFKKFVAENPQHLSNIAARSQIGNVAVQRAAILVDRAEKATDKEQKAKLLAEAETLFNESIVVFTDLVKQLVEKKNYGVPDTFDEKTKPAWVEKRDSWRADYLQTLILKAATREQLATVLEPGSKKHTDTLTEAAKDYAKIHETYSKKIAGLYALQYQARCLLQIKQKDNKKTLSDAVALLEQLIEIPDSSAEVRQLKLKTYAYASQAWLDNNQIEDLVKKGSAFIEDARPDEEEDPEFQQIRINVAKGCLKLAEQLKAKDPKAKDINNVLKQGAGYVKAAAKHPIYRKQTDELLAKFPANLARETAASSKQPKNFQDAFDSGKAALDSLKSAQLIMQTVPGRLKTEKDKAEIDSLTQQLKEAEDTLKTAKGKALEAFQFAIRKIEDDTSDDLIDTTRYYLCYLNFDAGNYYQALALGEFLAIRRPSSPGARQAALIAMSASQKLYMAEEGNRDFEANKIQDIARYIVEKWPDQKEAEDALNTLLPFLIKEGKFAEAQNYVKNIAADSPNRAMAELKLGQALWSNYVTGMRSVRELQNEIKDGNYAPGRTKEIAEAELKEKQGPLEQYKQNAFKTLEAGVERMKSAGQANDIVANAVLSLAQIYIDTNQATKAIQLLDDPKIGPLTLVKAKDPAVEKVALVEEIYKTALRANISSLQTADAAGAQAAIDRAKQLMDALKAVTGGTAAGQDRLVRSYVGIAADLQTQLSLAQAGDAKNNLAKGFETFLDVVGKEATEFNIINWVASTYRGMGDAFKEEKNAASSDKAKVYYKKAVENYTRILEEGAKKPALFPSPQAKTVLMLQVASTYRNSGDFVNAAKTFKEILSQNQGLINVQIEAAYNYQAWADASTKPEIVKMYDNAIAGAALDPSKGNDPKNMVIWGWKKLGDKLSGHQNFVSQFFESRYNLAYCYYKYARGTEDEARKKKLFGYAKIVIELNYQNYPEMGGPDWYKRFNSLYINIKNELGEKGSKGLESLKTEKKEPAPAVGATTAS